MKAHISAKGNRYIVRRNRMWNFDHFKAMASDAKRFKLREGACLVSDKYMCIFIGFLKKKEKKKKKDEQCSSYQINIWAWHGHVWPCHYTCVPIFCFCWLLQCGLYLFCYTYCLQVNGGLVLASDFTCEIQNQSFYNLPTHDILQEAHVLYLKVVVLYSSWFIWGCKMQN